MLITDLEIVIEECERFLKKAKPLLTGSKRAKKTESYITSTEHAADTWKSEYVTHKQNAAVKRSSLDLSRALVEIRKYK